MSIGEIDFQGTKGSVFIVVALALEAYPIQTPESAIDEQVQTFLEEDLPDTEALLQELFRQNASIAKITKTLAMVEDGVQARIQMAFRFF